MSDLTLGDRVRSLDRHHHEGVIEKVVVSRDPATYGVRCDDGAWRIYFEDEIEPIEEKQ